MKIVVKNRVVTRIFVVAVCFFSVITTLISVLNIAPVQAKDSIIVRVGSKMDTEGALLGNIILQILEANGIKTTSRIQLGSTGILRSAIIAGEIDIYPEYTGNGALFFSDGANPSWKNPQGGYETVKRLDYKKNKLVWLTPAPANNAWTIAIRQDLAQANNIKTLNELSQWIASGGKFKLAASAEFIERSDALPAFEQAYGFKLKPHQLLSLAGGNTALMLNAAAQNTSGVNLALAYRTDGQVSALGLRTLEDTKGIQVVYAPAPVIRETVLKAYPAIPELLKPVFTTLDDKTLQKLNALIVVEGQDVKKVVARYLQENGFLASSSPRINGAVH
jgi:osmoprotectant transport system substrate-binding protein